MQNDHAVLDALPEPSREEPTERSASALLASLTAIEDEIREHEETVAALTARAHALKLALAKEMDQQGVPAIAHGGRFLVVRHRRTARFVDADAKARGLELLRAHTPLSLYENVHPVTLARLVLDVDDDEADDGWRVELASLVETKEQPMVSWTTRAPRLFAEDRRAARDSLSARASR